MIPRKSSAPAKPAAPKASAPIAAPVAQAATESTSTFVRTPGKQPDFLLKYKQGKDGQYTRVVGLYEQDGRNGGEKYLKGFDKAEGITWVVMPNTYVKKEE